MKQKLVILNTFYRDYCNSNSHAFFSQGFRDEYVQVSRQSTSSIRIFLRNLNNKL